MRSCMPSIDMMEWMLALKDELAIDLIAQHHDVAIADCARDRGDVLLGQHAACRVLWRIQNKELCAIVDRNGELIDVEPEFSFNSSRNWRHRFRTDIVDHRLVDREAGIRVNDFISVFGESQNGKKDDRLATGNDDHFVGRHVYPARLAHLVVRSLRATPSCRPKAP